MKRYHITFRKNGILCFTNFAYHSEEEKDEHLKYWKEKHVSPYNKIEILMHGEDVETNYGMYEEKRKKLRGSKAYRVYAKLFLHFNKSFARLKKIA